MTASVSTELALLVDVGSAWAKAGVVGRARGRWRIVAHAAQPTSWGAPELRRQLVEQLEAVDDAEWRAFADDGMPDDLAHLLDSMFYDQVPIAHDLMRLLEQRGWTGWTKNRRIEPWPAEVGRPGR